MKSLLWLAMLLCGSVAAIAQPPRKAIVLIGGPPSHGRFEHDFPDGVEALRANLATSPDTRALEIRAFPSGWPDDPAAFSDAATIVFYCDGLTQQPLLDPQHSQLFEQWMTKGVGVVMLHQASTVRPGDKAPDLARWLGGVRHGMIDRADETVALTPAAHAISRGVKPFAYKDEFYPTVDFQGSRIAPILMARLHAVDATNGAVRIITAPVAWAFERPGGGRSFTFTGLHYLAGLDHPELRKLLLNAILWSAGLEVPPDGIRSGPTGPVLTPFFLPRVPVEGAQAGIDKLTYHQDAARSGWNAKESVLTPGAVKSGAFGPLWQSSQLDSFGDVPPRLFATPLYVHSIRMTAGPARGRTLAVAYVATSTGFAYAIATQRAGAIAPGTILWRTRLAAKPCGKGQFGNLSTPVIDLPARRLYVESCDSDREEELHALDLGSGRERAGWPVAVNAAAIDTKGLNRNGTRHWAQYPHLQRGALNLSADGRRLYVAFGLDSSGWLVVIDTARRKVASAFSSTPRDEEEQGGMWASAGPAVDGEGRITIATGANFNYTVRKRKLSGVFADSAGDWGASILQFRDDRAQGLKLTGSYTPFNYCQTAMADIDLGSSGTIAIDLPAGAAKATRLLVLGGGKQGNFYLLDRDRLPGRLDRRHPCSNDPESDGSLLAPGPQPHFGLQGPINLFGPYSDYISALDQAKSRSTAAWFRDATGRTLVFVSGSTKTGEDFSETIPPGLARVEIVIRPGLPPYPRVDGLEKTQAFLNPGSPILSSDGAGGAIVWLLDPNARRTQSLYGEGAPLPVLYAFDALSFELLWRSKPGTLYPSGKYNEPTVADGLVLVGTDRLQAFGLRSRAAPHVVARPAASTPASMPAKPSVTAPADLAALGRSTFQARCSGCHESGQPGIPARAALSALARQRIVDALTKGPMKAMAAGLSGDQIEGVAIYLKK